MGLLKNRIRTITGEDTTWYVATSRLLFYVLHPRRYANLATKIVNRVLHPAPNYQNWISQRSFTIQTSDVTDEPIHFIIFTHTNQNQTYPHVTCLPPGRFPLPEANNTYILYLEKGDSLHPNACALIASTISRTNANIITFDWDEMQGHKRVNPHFMPAWSPVRLWFDAYIRNAVCVSLAAIDSLLEPYGWNESLRQLSLKPMQASRIAEVLLTKTNQPNAQKQQPLIVGNPLVSIIIPTHNKAHLVKQCIDSIVERSSYSHYEIVLVDNNSNQPELLALVQTYQTQLAHKFVCVKAAYPFNFSQLINDGANHCNGSYLVLLNNDTEVKSPDWLEQLLMVASHPLSGAVGAKLLYPDDTIQHAGIRLHPQNISNHVYLGKQANQHVYENALNTLQEYCAVTAACLMVSKAKFDLIGGFDVAYRVEYNDLDFCLRLLEQGLHNVYTPRAVLYHYESASRQHPMASRKSAQQHYAERLQMETRWKPYIQNDPYGHPNRELFRL
jgi:GT2 family glycosyltransferase